MNSIFALLLLASSAPHFVVASEFGKWKLPVKSFVSTPGMATVDVGSSSFARFLSTTAPILIDDPPNSETVIPATVYCSAATGTCSFTATFTKAHPDYFTIRSATYGLQEAIDAELEGGGTVLLPPNWQGTNAIIQAVAGSTEVALWDLRNGSNFYRWDGVRYAVPRNTNNSSIATATSRKSVKAYGAKGDGFNNDTAAIQNAAIAVSSSGGGELYFPRGTYITSNFTIGSNTQVRCEPGALLKDTTTANERGIISAIGKTNLRVDGCALQRTHTNGNSFFDFIFFENSKQIWIENNIFLSAALGPTAPFGNRVVSMNGCEYQWIRNNYIYNPADNAIGVTFGSTPHSVPGESVVEGNIVHRSGNWNGSMIIVTSDRGRVMNNTFVADAISGPGVALMFETSDDVSDITFRGNRESTDVPLQLFVARSGNDFVIGPDNVGQTITIVAADGDIDGAQIFGNDLSGFFHGISVLSKKYGLSNVKIVNNHIHDGFGDQLGIRTQAVNNLEIRNNNIHDYGGSGIEVAALGDGTTLIRNNSAFHNGIVSGGDDDGTGAGMYILANATGSRTISISGNEAKDSAGWQCVIDQPQNVIFIDNQCGSGGLGSIRIKNATMNGPVPFLDLRNGSTASTSTIQQPRSIALPREGRVPGLAILPDEGVLLADGEGILRLDANGKVSAQYGAAGGSCWHGVSMDADSRSFWAADYCAEEVYKFDLVTGAIVFRGPAF